jgi:arylsulfatase A-like enzyme
VDGSQRGSLWQEHAEAVQSGRAAPRASLQRTLTTPGYDDSVMYEVNDRPPEQRMLGITTDLALDFLRETEHRAEPWCCFVSCIEPHDPYMCGEEAVGEYDVDSLELPPSAHDDLAGRPGLYRKAARVFADLSDRERREAMACYYGMISEIDAQYGRLLEYLDSSGQRDRTMVVLTSDHGDLMGAHGLYLKHVAAFEEIYEIPMVLAGPGVAQGIVSNARVGLHDLCPTLCEAAEVPAIGAPESRSFRGLLREPAVQVDEFNSGYAEYSGTRYLLTQRVIWDGDWKLVWNGFDFDELYNLTDDPYELRNLIDEPAHEEHVRRLMTRAWGIVRDSGDHALYRSGNWVLRLAPIGPRVLDA